MLKKLIKLSDYLDQNGFHEESAFADSIIVIASSQKDFEGYGKYVYRIHPNKSFEVISGPEGSSDPSVGKKFNLGHPTHKQILTNLTELHGQLFESAYSPIKQTSREFAQGLRDEKKKEESRTYLERAKDLGRDYLPEMLGGKPSDPPAPPASTKNTPYRDIKPDGDDWTYRQFSDGRVKVIGGPSNIGKMLTPDQAWLDGVNKEFGEMSEESGSDSVKRVQEPDEESVSMITSIARKALGAPGLPVHYKGFLLYLMGWNGTVGAWILSDKEKSALLASAKASLGRRNVSQLSYNNYDAVAKSTGEALTGLVHQKDDPNREDAASATGPVASVKNWIGHSDANGVTRKGNSIRITDTYDFNRVLSMESKDLSGFLRDLAEAWDELQDDNIMAAVHQLAAWRMYSGYAGYPIDVTLTDSDTTA